MQAGGHQSGDVRHIDQEERADGVGDLAEAGEIEDARIGAGAGDDHLGLMLLGEARQLVVVDGLGFLAHAVGDDLVGLAGEVELVAVGEVAAVGQVQAENRVAGLQHGGVGGLVGLRAGVRLHVGVFGVEELLGAVAGQVFDDVGELRSRRSSACPDSLRRTCW